LVERHASNQDGLEVQSIPVSVFASGPPNGGIILRRHYSRYGRPKDRRSARVDDESNWSLETIDLDFDDGDILLEFEWQLGRGWAIGCARTSFAFEIRRDEGLTPAAESGRDHQQYQRKCAPKTCVDRAGRHSKIHDS
jgi:hypothetical protein